MDSGLALSCYIVPTSIQLCTEITNLCNKARQRSKTHVDRKEKGKHSLFTDSMIVYVEILWNLKTKPKRTPGEFSSAAVDEPHIHQIVNR